MTGLTALSASNTCSSSILHYMYNVPEMSLLDKIHSSSLSRVSIKVLLIILTMWVAWSSILVGQCGLL